MKWGGGIDIQNVYVAILNACIMSNIAKICFGGAIVLTPFLMSNWIYLAYKRFYFNNLDKYFF